MIGEVLGQFRILETIGAGGMGVVYRAHDERLDRDVALKVLPSGALTDEQVHRRFRREALALSRLNHPNIATVHDFNNQDGVDFLVMEWIPGQTLDAKIAGAPLPEREILRLAIQLAQGLDAAHQQDVVHRDLKPGNLRITPDGRLKILDFGLAMLRQAELTDAARTTELGEQPLVAGSPPYMAPEQLLGERVDSRSDVYGAGAVMYEMATGRRPWPEAHGARLIDAILHLPPLLPRELNSRLSHGLEAVILKSLDKDPDRRYQSCRELLVDLERLSAPSGITAPHPRPARRTTWAATVAAGALLAVLAGSGPGGARARLSSGPGIRSLAVLPIENRSGDASQEYFSDGMTDALIAELGQVSSLRVISRTSSMQYKGVRKPLPEIARELGVDAVLEGSVLRDGSRVRITAELVHAPSDRHLWARTYERELHDVITLQREVAGSVVQEVRAQLTEQEKTRLATPRPTNPEAYEACLKGRYFVHSGNEASLRKAVEQFQRAADLDPGDATAYAGLADAQTLLTVLLAEGYRSTPEEALTRVRALYAKALSLDANLPGAHAGLAFANFIFARDWPASERGFARALELNPSLAEAHELHAWQLTARGRLEEALVEMKRARELDPLSPLITAAVARVFLCKHQVPEAIAQYQKSLELKQDFLPGHYGLGMAYMVEGQHQKAIEQFKQAHALSEQSPPIVADLAHAYALAGQRKAALGELERWQRLTARGYRPYEQAAHVYGALGEAKEAFASLEKAMESRSYGLVWLKVDPRFDPLRSDPRFKELLSRLGLSS